MKSKIPCSKNNNRVWANACMLLLLILVIGAAAASAGGLTPSQVSAKLSTFGPFSFTAPQGYWYFPHLFPEKGLNKNEDFIVTFFEKKEDIPRKDDYRYPTGVIFNFVIFQTDEKDVSYFTDASLDRPDITVKDPPQVIKTLFSDLPNWACKEDIIHGYPADQYGIGCVTVIDYGITMIAFGVEEAVRQKLPILKEMMSSLRVAPLSRGKVR